MTHRTHPDAWDTCRYMDTWDTPWTNADSWTHGHIRIKGHMKTFRHMDTWGETRHTLTHVVTWTNTVTCTHADI